MSFSQEIFFMALLINLLPILLTYLSSFLFIANMKQMKEIEKVLS